MSTMSTTADDLSTIMSPVMTAQSSEAMSLDSEKEEETDSEQMAKDPTVYMLPYSSWEQHYNGGFNHHQGYPPATWPILINSSALAFNALAAAQNATPPPLSWTENVYTVMLRNLPNKLNQQTLVKELEAEGFGDSYDFLYLPLDSDTKVNKGYAFINFVNPGLAMMFRQRFEGRTLSQFNSTKVLSVTPASLQGFEANYRRHCRAQGNQIEPDNGPVFLRNPKQASRTKAGSVAASPENQPKEEPANVKTEEQLTTSTTTALEPSCTSNDATVVVKFCTDCGGRIGCEFKFCHLCGRPVSSVPRKAEK